MTCPSKPLAPPSIARLAVSNLQTLERSTRNRGLFKGNELVNHELLLWWYSFQKEAHRLGVPLRVVEGFRSHAAQDAAFRRGASRARAGQSPHQYGLALDIIHMTKAYDLSPPDWLLLGTFGKEVARKRGLNLDWGGDWGADWSASPPQRGWDCAHWQIHDWPDLVPD